MKSRRPQQLRPSHFPATKAKETPINNRDSDASNCSRRSSALSRQEILIPTDRASQSSALKSVNNYFSARNFPPFYKTPPSAKEITEAFRFILRDLSWEMSKLEDDVPFLLKYLNCPLKASKSAFKAPSTPHSWPPLLAAMQWLVQFITYSEHLQSEPLEDPLIQYIVSSHTHYINEDDESVAALDQQYLDLLQQEKQAAEEEARTMEKEIADVEARIQEMKTGPDSRRSLEGNKTELMKDFQKFQTIVDNFSDNVVALEKGLVEKEKELGMKLREYQRICDENRELKERIDLQTVNVRDVEKMRREIQVVEQEFAETELARNAWEEKGWDLEASLRNTLNELKDTVDECNQAIKRLKIGNGLQFVLNGSGLSLDEVLGIDYKSMVKPILLNFLEEMKRSSVTKYEELIGLQKQLGAISAKLEEKRSENTVFQEKLDKAEALQKLLKREIQDHDSKCAAEAEKLRKDAERKTHALDIREKEADNLLENSILKLETTRKHYDEEIGKCGNELLQLIDAISSHKEDLEKTFGRMKTAVYETAVDIAKTINSSP